MGPLLPLPPEDMTAYIDGELSEQERADIDAMLDSDEALRQEADELRSLVSLLGGLSQYEPPRSLKLSPDQLRDAAPRTTVVRFVPALRSLSLAAVAAFVLVTSFAVYDRLESTDSPSNFGDSDVAETTEPDNASLDTTGDQPADNGGLVDRGESAASNAIQPEAPSSSGADAAAPDESGIAQADATPTATDAAPDDSPAPIASADDSDDGSNNRWFISSAVLGVLSLALIGFWMYLGKTGRART
ncbi:MAG: hypothetical protein WKF81_10475 [Thermomicrobiales bacterium]